MNKPQIRVTIETDEHVLKNLTPEQAKELRDILLQMFPVSPPVVKEIYHHDHYPWPRWTYTHEPTYWTISDGISTSTLNLDAANNSSSSAAVLWDDVRISLTGEP